MGVSTVGVQVSKGVFVFICIVCYFIGWQGSLEIINYRFTLNKSRSLGYSFLVGLDSNRLFLYVLSLVFENYLKI